MTQLTFLAESAISSGNHVYIVYGLFLLIIFFFLALDLGVFHRKAHEISMKEAAGWSAVWVTIGLGFSGLVYLAYENHWLDLGTKSAMYNPMAAHDPNQPLIVHGEVGGATAAMQYLTGYIVEQSLSMDNIFVIALIFSYFHIPSKFQHRVLFWGILGALVMRGAMIAIGGGLIMRYQWILIFFGLFLLLTALKMMLMQGHTDLTKNPVIRLVRRIFPVTEELHGQHFFARLADGRLAVTPIFLALVMVEITDVVFAVDSIPAIFAITPDSFIVFTSNIFAIMGLRSLYFCLSAMILRFKYLKPALILILGFVGLKLLLLSVPPHLDWIGLTVRKSIKVDSMISLSVVLGILGLAIVASYLGSRKTDKPAK